MKEDYIEINSDWLNKIVNKYISTCKQCGDINIDSAYFSSQATLYYNNYEREDADFICKDCKIKNERDSKIDNILE